MDNELSQHNMRDDILQKIREGRLSMKSKPAIVFRLIALILVSIFILVISAFLISYIIFNLKVSGHLFLVGFGPRGLLSFFLLFPWAILFVDVLFIIVLDWLLKEFSFGYKNPFIYLFLYTLGFIILIGYVIGLTSLHDMLLDKAERRELPVGAFFYKDLRFPHIENGIFMGRVVSIGTSTFVVEYNDFDNDKDDCTTTVITPNNIDVSSLVHIGQDIFVAGDKFDGGVRAFGVRQVDMK